MNWVCIFLPDKASSKGEVKNAEKRTCLKERERKCSGGAPPGEGGIATAVDGTRQKRFFQKTPQPRDRENWRP